MIFEIDNREPTKIKEYFTGSDSVYSKYTKYTKFKNLEQGDFIIRDAQENIILLFERKTIDDLLASVKDSRYSEQCERYSQLELPNNKIYYIIEGNLNNLQKDSTEYKTVYSCIFSLSFKKDFSVLFTDNINSTIILLKEFLIRIQNYKDKNPETSSSKLVKKQVITKENIDSYMLNLIPGIGLNTAKEILNNFDGKIYNLIHLLKIDKENGRSEENSVSEENNINEILNGITIKSRKLSKKIIQSIKDFLK